MKKNNGSKEAIIELWGQEFNIVSKGLDEDQVVSFVSALIGERDVLVRRVGHLSSLTRLAEKTIVESDKLAEEIKKETVDQAKAEANAIVAKAEEQAQQLIEEKRTEIITIATEEAEALKADAEREAKLLIEDHRRKIQPELRDMAQRVYDQLLYQLESLKQQVIDLNGEFEHKLSQPAEETSAVTIGQEPRTSQVPTTIQQGNNMMPDIGSEVSIERVDLSAEPQQLTQTVDQTDMSKLEEKIPVSADNQDAATYVEQVELEILPPINIMQIMRIMEYLDNLPEIGATELIPLYDKPSIIVSLREPLPLFDILKTLPEVEEVIENTDGEIAASADTATAEGKRRKIQIRLSEGKTALDEAEGKTVLDETEGKTVLDEAEGKTVLDEAEGKTVLDETKERLNNEVSKILSDLPHSSPK